VVAANQMELKTKNVCCLALYQKSVLTPQIKERRQAELFS
jgi:hypothetical protein